MTSDALKTEALCWLRYGKKCSIVCTEVAGSFSADVLGVSDTMSIEVEVKVSKSDLRRDFTAKAAKHAYYQLGLAQAPSYFYFLVPEALVADTEALLAEKAPAYGIAVYHGSTELAGRNVSVHKRPGRLNKEPPSHRMIQTALARCSSELCGLHLANDRYANLVMDEIREIKRGSVLSAFRAAGALDIEDVDDIDARASELAFCVDGADFKNLDESRREHWREAAKRYLEARYYNGKDWVFETLRRKR